MKFVKIFARLDNYEHIWNLKHHNFKRLYEKITFKLLEK